MQLAALERAWQLRARAPADAAAACAWPIPRASTCAASDRGQGRGDRRRRRGSKARRAGRRRAHRSLLPAQGCVARRGHGGERALRPGRRECRRGLHIGPTRACGPAPSWPRACTWATSSRPRRRGWVAPAKPTTSATWVMPTSARR
jgi:hypothetical protein